MFSIIESFFFSLVLFLIFVAQNDSESYDCIITDNQITKLNIPL